ncbi:MAG: protein phosphatase 2C domain-containing protein [Pseudomonadota bacterium]
MSESRELRFDVATALSVGQRDHQEDAVVTDFAYGTDSGFAVLADGMGGHAAGDVASKLVVTEVFSALKFGTEDPDTFSEQAAEILLDAARIANESVRMHMEGNPDTEGMGSTLLAPVIVNSQLYWISVGDSPLYLFREGRLYQLNDDHSLAPQIDLMAAQGLIEPEVARNHPDRNALTSVLFGEAIPQVDCPEEPFELEPGDILVMASDGLQFLSNSEISALLRARGRRSSADIVQTLLTALEKLEDPEQDNVSICIVKVGLKGEIMERRPPSRPIMLESEEVQPEGKGVSLAERLRIARRRFFQKPAAFALGGR